MSERVANIGARGARQRRAAGGVALLCSAILFAWLLSAHAPRSARLALVIPLAFAAIGFFQASARTCVAHCVLGTRDADAGGAPTDTDRPIIRRQAIGVVVKSIAAAAVITAVLYLV